MKKFFVFSILSVFSMNSFAEFSLTCTEMYSRTIQAKNIKKNKAGNLSNELGTAGFITSLGAPVVGLALMVPAVGLSLYSDAASREEKVMDLAEGSRRLDRLTKRMQKKVHSDITSEEIMAIVTEGLESGHFCRLFPHLYTPSEVKKHVKETLKLKYAHRQ